jgi:hypothetical protein
MTKYRAALASLIEDITSNTLNEGLETSALQRKPIREDITKVPTLTIIVASYNAHEFLAHCARSVYRNPTIEPHDSSAGRTSEMARARCPEVRLE